MKKLIVMLSTVGLLSACAGGGSGANSNHSNPLLAPSSLELEAPDFTKINPEDFLPAFQEGMRVQLLEIDSIINNPEPATFENTLVALQQTGQLLTRTSKIFFGLASAEATDKIREIENEIVPLLTAHQDAINLNDALFARIKAVKEGTPSLSGEDQRLLQVVYDNFVRRGANLNESEKARLKRINEELAGLENKFSNQVKDATLAAGILVDKVEELAGLSAESLASAKDDATKAGHDGKYLLTLSNTTRSAYLSELDNRELRRKLLEASLNRSEQGDQNDTQQIVKDITRLRAEKASLLGHKDYASWGLTNQMAQNPDNVYSFIGRIIDAYLPKIEQDKKELEAFARTTAGADFKLEAWDWDYYANKLRKAKYDLDENDIKPYFALDSVVKNGLFYMAKELYGIEFKERTDLPIYAEGVKTYDVIDKDGTKFALFYTDYYRRPTKRGGAWMSTWVSQSHLLGKKPVVYNVCNYAPPVDGQPTLLNMDEVTTLFHEFGHGLHGLFANQKYELLSGTSVSRDFVEMPSQFHEHWATDPKVLSNYAKHYKTGEPMPQELLQKMEKAANFNQAYQLGENLAAVVIDMAWHTIDGKTEVKDVKKFEQDALSKMRMNNAQVPPRYRSTYFRHSMGGGYSAGYYAYLWAEVLDNNAYDWFRANGGLNSANGQRLRDIILSRGNSEDLNKIFQEMTGLSEPNIQSLMKARGLQ